ncbi:hypothetical protein AVEN_32662-1 [Araneus ventricosus]|uniref:RNase H type-1 domain-containing protein n=1 Tax=Araneus ventricosus TaxID=182803 RepID=A0A4Y2C7H8_ARAVE|nr:hypothetical protein AVEN_32662-1 [Araneus ventricosus]
MFDDCEKFKTIICCENIHVALHSHEKRYCACHLSAHVEHLRNEKAHELAKEAITSTEAAVLTVPFPEAVQNKISSSEHWPSGRGVGMMALMAAPHMKS